MSEKALGNRIKAIERAAGQHAVVKMRLFARVLCLEGFEDLAHAANDALQVTRRRKSEMDVLGVQVLKDKSALQTPPPLPPSKKNNHEQAACGKQLQGRVCSLTPLGCCPFSSLSHTHTLQRLIAKLGDPGGDEEEEAAKEENE
jgi:hypothetical protein